MVAVTVILAAVIAAAVMGMGDGIGNTAPTTNTDVSTNSDWDPSNPGTSNTHPAVYVSHSSGDSIEFENLRLVVRDEDGASLATLDYDESSDSFTSNGDTEIDVSNLDLFDAGATLSIESDESGGDLAGEDTLNVQVVHTKSDTTVTDSTVEF